MKLAFLLFSLGILIVCSNELQLPSYCRWDTGRVECGATGVIDTKIYDLNSSQENQEHVSYTAAFDMVLKYIILPLNIIIILYYWVKIMMFVTLFDIVEQLELSDPGTRISSTDSNMKESSISTTQCILNQHPQPQPKSAVSLSTTQRKKFYSKQPKLKVPPPSPSDSNQEIDIKTLPNLDTPNPNNVIGIWNITINPSDFTTENKLKVIELGLRQQELQQTSRYYDQIINLEEKRIDSQYRNSITKSEILQAKKESIRLNTLKFDYDIQKDINLESNQSREQDFYNLKLAILLQCVIFTFVYFPTRIYMFKLDVCKNISTHFLFRWTFIDVNTPCSYMFYVFIGCTVITLIVMISSLGPHASWVVPISLIAILGSVSEIQFIFIKWILPLVLIQFWTVWWIGGAKSDNWLIVLVMGVSTICIGLVSYGIL